jgi:hypothetical protein
MDVDNLAMPAWNHRRTFFLIRGQVEVPQGTIIEIQRFLQTLHSAPDRKFIWFRDWVEKDCQKKKRHLWLVSTSEQFKTISRNIMMMSKGACLSVLRNLELDAKLNGRCPFSIFGRIGWQVFSCYILVYILIYSQISILCIFSAILCIQFFSVFNFDWQTVNEK